MPIPKVSASDIKVVKSGDIYQVKGRPRESFEIIKIYHPSNLPGKQIVVGRVLMDPRAATPPHTHNNAAIVAVVTEGTVLNQMNEDNPILTSKGEVFYESPGCHHVLCENNTQEKVSFIVVLIVDDEVVKDGYESLVVLDAEKQDGN
ncbi:cupin domain-containing protein [Aspergillus foveolatus]|uniref:cupin domain-containing protein n=1 Tax=Aspergillus foveolatus TaxID=210207 RepID=UPI003CCD60B2